jgi:opacity protein-like surface antigen
MNSRYIVTLTALCGAWSLAANARDPGWEFGGELIYQDSFDISSDVGSTASIDSDVGIALTFGYRFNDRFELAFGLDWNTIDYTASLVGDTFPGLVVDVDGELEAFTPRVGANFNFMEGPITPYVTGMIGYSFIDTNIPDGPAQGGCWWDPFWGIYICDTWQPTRSSEEFIYGAGLGVRWDVNDSWTARLAYEKRWLDTAESPDFDQIKLGFAIQY